MAIRPDGGTKIDFKVNRISRQDYDELRGSGAISGDYERQLWLADGARGGVFWGSVKVADQDHGWQMPPPSPSMEDHAVNRLVVDGDVRLEFPFPEDGISRRFCLNLDYESGSVSLPDGAMTVGDELAFEPGKSYFVEFVETSRNVFFVSSKILPKPQYAEVGLTDGSSRSVRVAPGEVSLAKLQSADPSVTRASLAAVMSLPDGVSSVAASGFAGCSSLSSFPELGGSLTSVGSEAFLDCHMLSSLTVAAGLSSVGNGAFRRNAAEAGLSVHFPGRVLDQVKAMTGYPWDLSFPRDAAVPGEVSIRFWDRSPTGGDWTEVKEQIQTRGGSATPPNLSGWPGYALSGWTDEDSFGAVWNDLSSYAVWEELPPETFMVTYFDGLGGVRTTQSRADGDPLGSIPQPPGGAPYLTWSRWTYADGAVPVSSDVVSSNLSVYARWKANGKVVSCDLTTKNTSTQEYGGADVTLPPGRYKIEIGGGGGGQAVLTWSGGGTHGTTPGLCRGGLAAVSVLVPSDRLVEAEAELGCKGLGASGYFTSSGSATAYGGSRTRFLGCTCNGGGRVQRPYIWAESNASQWGMTQGDKGTANTNYISRVDEATALSTASGKAEKANGYGYVAVWTMNKSGAANVELPCCGEIPAENVVRYSPTGTKL